MLKTVAESTQRLPDELKALHPQVNWSGISGFRNVLVHNYLGLKLARVWEIIEDYLPGLEAAVREMLGEGGSEP